MEIPTWESVGLKKEIGEPLNPLEEMIYENEPFDLGKPYARSEDFRRELQRLVDWLLEQPQVTCAECGIDCRHDGPFYCSEHQR